jgi:VWFA-related protein
MKTWRQIRQISFCGALLLSLIFGGGPLLTGLAEKEPPAKEEAQEGKEVKRGGPQQPQSDPVVVRKRKPKPRKRRLNPARPKGSKLDDNFTLAVDIELVNLDVVVTDKRGNFIPNLTARNFRVFEDKVEQKVTNFSPTTAPLTVVMVLESTKNLAWWFYDDAVMPAAQFIQMLRPHDWAAVVAYNMNSKILSDFTQDKRELFAAISRIAFPVSIESNLFDALKLTLDRLDEVDGRKAVLLVSTGVDTFSRINFGAALRRVKSTDAVIYCLGIGQRGRLRNEPYMSNVSRLDYLQADNQLKTFAKVTGGKAWFPRWQQDHPAILRQVGIELRNQYSLGFVSSNAGRDGKFRKIKVEIVDENGKRVKKVKARTRTGYHAVKG